MFIPSLFTINPVCYFDPDKDPPTGSRTWLITSTNIFLSTMMTNLGRWQMRTSVGDAIHVGCNTRCNTWCRLHRPDCSFTISLYDFAVKTWCQRRTILESSCLILFIGQIRVVFLGSSLYLSSSPSVKLGYPG